MPAGELRGPQSEQERRNADAVRFLTGMKTFLDSGMQEVTDNLLNLTVKRHHPSGTIRTWDPYNALTGSPGQWVNRETNPGGHDVVENLMTVQEYCFSQSATGEDVFNNFASSAIFRGSNLSMHRPGDGYLYLSQHDRNHRQRNVLVVREPSIMLRPRRTGLIREFWYGDRPFRKCIQVSTNDANPQFLDMLLFDENSYSNGQPLRSVTLGPQDYGKKTGGIFGSRNRVLKEMGKMYRAHPDFADEGHIFRRF